MSAIAAILGGALVAAVVIIIRQAFIIRRRDDDVVALSQELRGRDMGYESARPEAQEGEWVDD